MAVRFVAREYRTGSLLEEGLHDIREECVFVCSSKGLSVPCMPVSSSMMGCQCTDCSTCKS